MLSVSCWKWKPKAGLSLGVRAGDRQHAARDGARGTMQKPHRFICVTDDADGIDPGVEIVPLWDDYAAVPSPCGARQPSCYRRLKAFSREAPALFGARFVSLDLDCVVTGDLAPLWDREEDFVIWGDTSPRTPYNGSMFLLRAGARRQVWEDFDPKTSPAKGRALGYFGSDQAWIGARLGPHEKRSGRRPTASIRIATTSSRSSGELPDNARIVMFHGASIPGRRSAALAWVRH
jgi:hypothetical protein